MNNDLYIESLYTLMELSPDEIAALFSWPIEDVLAVLDRLGLRY